MDLKYIHPCYIQFQIFLLIKTTETAMKTPILLLLGIILGLDASGYVDKKQGVQYLDAKFLKMKNTREGVLLVDGESVLKKERTRIELESVSRLDFKVEKKYKFKRIPLKGTRKVKFKHGEKCIVNDEDRLKMGSCRAKNALFVLSDGANYIWEKFKTLEMARDNTEDMADSVEGGDNSFGDKIGLIESRMNTINQGPYSRMAGNTLSSSGVPGQYSNIQYSPSYGSNPTYNNSQYSPTYTASYSNSPYSYNGDFYKRKYMEDFYRRMAIVKSIETNPNIPTENKEILKSVLRSEDPTNMMIIMFSLLNRNYNPEEDTRLINLIKNEIRLEMDKSDIQQLKTQAEIQKAMGGKKPGLGDLAKLTPMGALASNLV